MTESMLEAVLPNDAVEGAVAQEAAGPESAESGPSKGLMARLLATIQRLSAGERAELRRDPGTSLAFYKLRATHFPRVTREDTEERWQVLVQAIAILADLYDPTAGLGTALARAELSEARLNRLLRADSSTLPKHIRSCARFLAAKGQQQNMVDIARLLDIKPADNSSERVRRRIAADYFRALSK